MYDLLIFLHDTDLAHLYSKFIAPLPSTGEEYISSIAKYFPHIIDTKLLLNNSDVFQVMKRKRSTSLAKAFAFLCPEIVSGVKTNRSAYKPCIKVEVQVDDTRFTFFCIYYFLFFLSFVCFCAFSAASCILFLLPVGLVLAVPICSTFIWFCVPNLTEKKVGVLFGHILLLANGVPEQFFNLILFSESI